MEDTDTDAFVRWFQSNGGHLDTQAMGITEILGSGRGAIALCDIPAHSTLFTLPRTLTLSTRTSPLPSLFGVDAWRAHGLHRGWVGLILCIMWEDAWTHATNGGGQDEHGVKAKWGPYVRTLPTAFDTPMFWRAEELAELNGTAVMDKIGRDDAERSYSERLVPAIKTSPTLFPPAHHQKWYTLDAYHRAGSRILSRSFTVSRWEDDDHEGEGGSDADETKDVHANTSAESSMTADVTHLDDPNEGLGLDSDEEEEDDYPSDVAMVPMADLLNARWGSENAKLFHEPLILRMITTKEIKQGEQIFNTYGDPPNSDLLRRYGHVDLVPLDSSSGLTPDEHGDVEMKERDMDTETIMHLGNPSDVVEIRADLVVDVVQTTDSGAKTKDMGKRIEWWLDEGEDDIFVLSMPAPGSPSSEMLPPALISLTRLLLLPDPDFTSARSKGKLPKGRLRKSDVEDHKEVLAVLDQVFEQREGMYVGGSVEDEEGLLSFPPETLGKNKRHAAIVRLGEKRILRDVRKTVREMLAELAAGGEKDDTKKGKGSRKEAGSDRKRVVSGAEGGRGVKKARR